MEEADMIGPLNPIEKKDFWNEIEKQESLFPGAGEYFESTDVIVELNTKLEELTDLCERLSFSLREIRQVLKVKSLGHD